VAPLIVAVLFVCVSAQPRASAADVVRHPVYAGGESWFGTCTDPGIPPPGTVCTDNYVLFWKGVAVEGGGSVAPVAAPWQIYIETDRVEFTGAEEPDVTVVRWGYSVLPDGAASGDSVHLSTASVTASVPMSDGSSADFAGTWQAWSDRLVFGIDGPATGLEHHYVDRCLTIVANGHQKFRFSHMIGTFDGAPVQSYDYFDFAATIFDNNFQYIAVPHRAPACA